MFEFYNLNEIETHRKKTFIFPLKIVEKPYESMWTLLM